MTRAAIYARFSSDSQRDESIEIQVRECTALIEREGWSGGIVYSDYAMSGTTAERPGFQQCLVDGERRGYDVLVVYKSDRMARNVAIAQDFKKRLFTAGVRIVSVREGELTDTPDGFLLGGIGDLFAEYYSRNLSVLIRGGIQANARKCRASGIRRYGYDVDAEDHFVVNDGEAEVVRSIFGMYISGSTAGEVAGNLNARGILNKQGREWTRNAIYKMLRNRAYAGEYSYAGVTVPDGIPAIVDWTTFEMAQRAVEGRNGSTARRRSRDYLLSGRLRCLSCGELMRGDSGTGMNGRKYAYYKCRGCGTRLPAAEVEGRVLGGLSEELSAPESLDLLAEDILQYGESLPDPADGLRKALSNALRRRDNLVASIAEGVPPSAVRDALTAAEDEVEALRGKLGRLPGRGELLDAARIREFAASIAREVAEGGEVSVELLAAYVPAVYADAECAVIPLDFGGESVRLDELASLASAVKNGETPGETGISPRIVWWTRVPGTRNLYRLGTFGAIVLC